MNISAQTQSVNPHTYTNKRGLTVLCERSGVRYAGLRHRLNRLDVCNGCNKTIDIFAHHQENVGWRLLCVEQDHDMDLTTASYVGEIYAKLEKILDYAEEILVSIGYHNT